MLPSDRYLFWDIGTSRTPAEGVAGRDVPNDEDSAEIWRNIALDSSPAATSGRPFSTDGPRSVSGKNCRSVRLAFFHVATTRTLCHHQSRSSSSVAPIAVAEAPSAAVYRLPPASN